MASFSPCWKQGKSTSVVTPFAGRFKGYAVVLLSVMAVASDVPVGGTMALNDNASSFFLSFLSPL